MQSSVAQCHTRGSGHTWEAAYWWQSDVFAFSRGDVGIQLAPDRLIGLERPVDTGDEERQATREQQHRNEQGYENEVDAIAHPSHHADIQLLPSHLVERGLGGMSVRAWRSIITA